MKYNPTEREVIFLKAVKELIDEMVNFEIGEIIGSDPHLQFQFCSMTHQKFFNIILVDFLSCSDKRILGEQSSYLGALKSICSSPNFDKDSSIDNLAAYVAKFSDWLEKEFVVKKIWFPSIKLETDLSIKRVEFIKICGNISKHNFSRLSGVVREIKLIFDRNKISLNDDEALVIIEEFYDWFHDNIFSYHSSAIAEFLHNIRWGIYEYKYWPRPPSLFLKYFFFSGSRWEYSDKVTGCSARMACNCFARFAVPMVAPAWLLDAPSLMSA